MEVIYVLLPLALGMALFFLIAYAWAVRSGQMDDITTPAYRILIDDQPAKKEEKTEAKKDRSHSAEK